MSNTLYSQITFGSKEVKTVKVGTSSLLYYMFLSLGKRSGGRKAAVIERMAYIRLTLCSRSHQQKRDGSCLLAQFRRKFCLEIDDLDSFTFVIAKFNVIEASHLNKNYCSLPLHCLRMMLFPG